MKAFLVVLLLALAACDGIPERIIEIAKCIIQSPTIREVLPEIIAAVVEKDYMKIVTIVIGAFPKIKDEVVACLNK